MNTLTSLPVEQLAHRFDPRQFAFATSAELEDLGTVPGQGRATGAIELAVDIQREVELGGAIHSKGVLIPAANVDQLMLRDEVVAAAAEGKFRVYAVRTADKAIELLTGIPAGLPQDSGAGTQSSLNGRVAARLRDLAALHREQPRPGQIRRIARARAKHSAH